MHKSNMRKDEYTDQEKEYQYARWFWRGADIENWNFSKVIITGIIAITLGLLSFIALNSFLSAPINAGIIAALLFISLLLINGSIRARVSRFIAGRRQYHQTESVTMYDNLKFYFLEKHREVLFMETERDLTGIVLFKLKAIPRVIRGNFERFIRSLYQQQISVFWLYVQAPVEQGSVLSVPAISEEAREFYEGEPPYELESRMESRNGIWRVRILFGTRRSIPIGFNIEAKRITLYNQLTADKVKIETAFQSAYPHTILELLQGAELEKAMSLAITGGGIPAFF